MKESSTPVTPSAWHTFRTLLKYIWPKNHPDLRARVVFAFGCLTLSKGFNVLVPYFLKRAVDSLSIAVTPVVLPIALILSYGAARILQQAFGELRDFLFSKVSQKAQTAIAVETFVHLHQLSLRFHLDRQTGGLSRIIERGTSAVSYFLTFMTFNIVPTLFEILIVTVVLNFTFDSRFAGLTFVTIMIYILYTVRVTDWRVQYRRQMNEADTDANTKAVDSLLNYETVKYFGNEKHEEQRFLAHRMKFETSAIKSQATLSVLNVGQGFIIALGLIGIMVLAGRGVVAHTMTLGDFVMVNTYLIQLYMPLNFLGFAYREIRQGLIDMEKMFEILRVNREIADNPDARALLVDNGSIAFRDVVFSYRPERKVLSSVNFLIPPGQTVAIVGPSGSGKSTIARLLYRFYDVQSGTILIDGQDTRTVTQSSLRNAIGIVPQDTVLFNDTIEYNIRYGRPSASEDEIHAAARLAQIHDFVMTLPEQYKTRVGERGLKLSGGEKQRVAIARTILKDPKILIFDEATSALDSKTEREILSAFIEVSKDRSTLMIAHRLSTIVHADEILVLKEGQIVERGNHASLLKLRGEYFQMWQRQQEQAQYQEKLEQLVES